MMPHLLLAAALAGSPVCAAAQGGHCAPHGGPQHVNAQVINGDLEIQQFFTNMIPESYKVKKVVIGKDGNKVEVEETMTRFRTVTREVKQKVLLAKVQAFDSDGNKINAKTWPGFLKKSTPVLLGYGDEINANYFRILKKGTLVLILPNPEPVEGASSASLPIAPEDADIFAINFGQDEKPFPPSPKSNGPRGPQPNVFGASIDDQGLLNLMQTGNNKFDQDVTTTEKYQDDDVWKERKVQFKIKHTQFTMSKQALAAKYVKAHGVDGKAIDAKTLANLLKKHTTVLVSGDGKEVDPYYLQIFKEGTVVVQIPMPSHGVAPAPVRATPKSDDDRPPPQPPQKDSLPKSQPEKIKPLPPPKANDDVPAAKAGQMPEGAPPVFSYVMDIGPGALTCAHTNMTPVWKERTKTVTENGEVRQVVEKYLVWVAECQVMKFTADKGKILNTRNHPVSAEVAWGKLQKGSVVLMAYPDQKIDPAYLATLRPEMLVLVPPAVAVHPQPPKVEPKVLPKGGA